MKWITPLLLNFGAMLFLHAQDQPSYFNGIITYTYIKLDAQGKVDFFPIDIEEMRVSGDQILTKVIKGQYKNMVGNKELMVDSKNQKRFEIDHDERSITELKNELVQEKIELYDWKRAKDVVLLGDSCAVYSFKRVFSDPMTLRKDSLRYTYYISKNLKWKNAEVLASLQGNQNTKLMDGKLGGIPLLIKIEYPNGEKLTTEAVKIQNASLTFINLPDYPITKER